MASPRMDSSTHETMAGVGGALTGLGILIMALAPLAIPFLVLTVVFALPLVLLAIPPIAVGLAIWTAVRLSRRASARLRRRSLPHREPASIRMPSQARG